MATWDRELDVARAAAREAAEAVRALREGGGDLGVEEKADGKGPLTAADLASNQILTRMLKEAFPDDGLLSEETVDDAARLGKRRVWIIDPIDGTREFTERVPEYVVSVGLAVGGRPQVGVLVNPATGEVFTGVVGGEATYNGSPCRVTARGSLDGARLVVSNSEFKKGWFDHLEGVARCEPVGSVAYKFGLVAAGLADATFTPKPRNAWDLLGGVACVQAAGGRTCDGSGAAFVFNQPDPLKIGVVGTNGALHDAVMALVAR